MSRTRIKICGLTRADQARAVAACGVDAVGLVFYPQSPRCVTPPRAAEICRVLPPLVSTVGLFVNCEADAVRRILERCPLDLLQFHGDEDAAYCRQFDRPYVKVVSMRDDVDVGAVVRAHPEARAFLFDAFREGVPGGTGQTFAWERLPSVERPWILAGGLTPENVGAAVERLQPPAVDVSGGVEDAPGSKDPARVRRFVDAVRAADEHVHKEEVA